jgi:hypothetical protein
MPAVPEIIDPVFPKTSQNARFLLGENERFGLVLVKTGSINSGTGYMYVYCIAVKKYLSLLRYKKAMRWKSNSKVSESLINVRNRIIER